MAIGRTGTTACVQAQIVQVALSVQCTAIQAIYRTAQLRANSCVYLVLNRQSAARTFSIVKNNCSARTCYHSSAEARHKDFYKVQSWWVAEHRSLPLLRTVVAQESLGQSTRTALQLAIRYLANNLAFCVQPVQRSFVGKLFAVPKDDFQRRPRHFFTSYSVCIAFSKSLFFFIATVSSFAGGC